MEFINKQSHITDQIKKANQNIARDLRYSLYCSIKEYKKELQPISIFNRIAGLFSNKYLQHGGSQTEDISNKLVDIVKTSESILKLNKDKHYEHDMDLPITSYYAVDKLKLNPVLNNVLDDTINDTNNFTSIDGVFDAIYAGLEYTEQFDKQKLLMPKGFNKFTKSINGFLLGKTIYKKSEILDKLYGKVSIKQIQESLSDIIPITNTFLIENEQLDKIIQKAVFTTLAPPNKQIKQIIIDSIKIIESLIAKIKPKDVCIVYKIFNPVKMREILDIIFKSGIHNQIINKSCKIKHHLTTKVELSGGALGVNNQYINLIKILEEDINTDSDKCEFCNKFIRDKIVFKKVASKMVKKDNILDVLELMNASIEYLPVAILDKNEYHKFHIAIQKYKNKNKN